MSTKTNQYLDYGSSGSSDLDNGYDSEAAEIAKSVRARPSERNAKRRKLSHSDEEEDTERPQGRRSVHSPKTSSSGDDDSNKLLQSRTSDQDDKLNTVPLPQQEHIGRHEQPANAKRKHKEKEKSIKPGVVYLSSLPPYLKPSALRNLLIQRGFHPITRLFLTPASKASSTSKKNSRQLYTEGWIEFDSKKTARRCAETLNATTVGGKKGGFYHDDLWNMKYLKGMGWSELMAGIREEKREEEGRRDEERRTIARETKRFIEGVEEGKRVEGMKRKKSAKMLNSKEIGDADIDVKRTWRQFKVKGKDGSVEQVRKQPTISDEAREVLGKIF